VEIVTNVDNREKFIGQKRNELLRAARGDYTVFIDDDDMWFPGSVAEVLKGCDAKCDVMAINGTMNWFREKKAEQFIIAVGNEFVKDSNGVYLRFPNHITPMKRVIAMKSAFPNKSFFEDFEWAKALNDMDLYRDEYKIIPPVYNYRFDSAKNANHYAKHQGKLVDKDTIKREYPKH